MKTSSEKFMSDDFYLRDFFTILIQKKNVFAGVLVFSLVVVTLVYKLLVPYVGRGRILVNDSQNSSLQAFSTTYFGMTKSVVDGKKGNTQIGKQIEILKTREFYRKFIEKCRAVGEGGELSVEERQGYLAFKYNFLEPALTSKDEDRLIAKLDSWFQAKMESDYEIRVSFSTPSKLMSIFLTNMALELSTEFLKDREMAEIQRVESFISEQRRDVDNTIKGLTKEVAAFQTTNENIIAMTSREKMGEYLSDLMVRMNEIKLKMAENMQDIELLEQAEGGASLHSSSLYGSGGRVEFLRLENRMLSSRLSEIQASIKKLGESLRVLPVAVQVLDDKRKKADFEFAKYKELSETLAKVEAQKLSVRDRFEVLEKARGDNTFPQIEFATLMFLAVLISLSLGLTVIYFNSLWSPAFEGSPAIPNFMIVDSREDSGTDTVFS